MTENHSLELMEMEETAIVEGAPTAFMPVSKTSSRSSSPSPQDCASSTSTMTSTTGVQNKQGRDSDAKRFLCILGVAKLTTTACSTSASSRCTEQSHRECKACGEGMQCSNTYEEFVGLAFRVAGTGVDAEDYGSFGEAIGRAQDEGYTCRERGVEKLLLRTFSHKSQKVILVLSKSPEEFVGGRPSSPAEGESSASSSKDSVITTGEILSEVLHSAYISISKFLDGVKDEDRELAAITVTPSSAFKVVLPMELKGPPLVQLHEADAQARSFGFWRREPAVEAFLSTLPLDGGHKIVHVFSRLASKDALKK